ncbi:hypothetical protein MMC09_006324 [Bachmanniomyces sp. S44760]|nr:hypothetical protein [Bachmanniomyces sp. S44760]
MDSEPSSPRATHASGDPSVGRSPDPRIQESPQPRWEDPRLRFIQRRPRQEVSQTRNQGRPTAGPEDVPTQVDRDREVTPQPPAPQTPTGRSQQTPIDRSQQTPIGRSQQTPTGRSQQTPVGRNQQTPPSTVPSSNVAEPPSTSRSFSHPPPSLRESSGQELRCNVGDLNDYMRDTRARLRRLESGLWDGEDTDWTDPDERRYPRERARTRAGPNRPRRFASETYRPRDESYISREHPREYRERDRRRGSHRSGYGERYGRNFRPYDDNNRRGRRSDTSYYGNSDSY